MKGTKILSLPGTAGNVGIGSLGSPPLDNFEKLTSSNEFNDSRGMRMLSPNL
jgi:hypothetical protein